MPRGVRVNGERIRYLREMRMLLQRGEFARKVGLTEGAMYEVEVRRQTTTIPTLRKIAAGLGVHPLELVASDEFSPEQEQDLKARPEIAQAIA